MRDQKRNNKKVACPLFRCFQTHDAEFCYNTRRSAYVHEFPGELSPQEVTAAMNAYSPADYIRMAEHMPFFIVESNNKRVGFFTLKRLDMHTAEIPLVYISLDSIGKGLGSACITFIEKWIPENWPDIRLLIVDTIIPKYNSGFYQKVGFTSGEHVFCKFGELKVNAVRLMKQLNIGA